MFQIDWLKLNPETYYYCMDQYVFKKKKLKDYYVYTIWESEVLRFNTVNEYVFNKLAGKILNGEQTGWTEY